ncbi:16862_t:CDS:2, partial [Acaulospora colombiana]
MRYDGLFDARVTMSNSGNTSTAGGIEDFLSTFQRRPYTRAPWDGHGWEGIDAGSFEFGAAGSTGHINTSLDLLHAPVDDAT